MRYDLSSNQTSKGEILTTHAFRFFWKQRNRFRPLSRQLSRLHAPHQILLLLRRLPALNRKSRRRRTTNVEDPSTSVRDTLVEDEERRPSADSVQLRVKVLSPDSPPREDFPRRRRMGNGEERRIRKMKMIFQLLLSTISSLQLLLLQSLLQLPLHRSLHLYPLHQRRLRFRLRTNLKNSSSRNPHCLDFRVLRLLRNQVLCGKSVKPVRSISSYPISNLMWLNRKG